MINERQVVKVLEIIWFIMSAGVFISLFFVTAPYGRHKKQGWGISTGSRAAWIIMETPSPLLMLILFFSGVRTYSLMAVIFLILWEAHYINRSFIFPFLRGNDKKGFPVLILVFGFLFNLVNAYLNGSYLFRFSPGYSVVWLTDPRFITGLIVFISGMTVNINSDLILTGLRKKGGEIYKIPEGSLFKWVSCPNYLGEITEWTGWAIATWSVPGLLFALWTAANLAPRALSHHKWYKKEFPDYPPSRKALIPYLF